MLTPVFNTQGKQIKKISLPQEIFAVKPNLNLVAQAVRVHLANQRQGTSKVKNRGEVKGSRRKIWRQKGTGRARHGDRYAPIFVGGGVAHGPRGDRNYKLKLSKKMRRQALFSALTKKLSDQELFLVSGFDKLEPKTKFIYQTLKTLRKNTGKAGLKQTIIVTRDAETVRRAARNIDQLQLLTARQLNTYRVVNAGTIYVMDDAVESIKNTFLKPEKKKTGASEEKKSAEPEPKKIKTAKKTTGKKPAARKTKSKKTNKS